MFYNQKQLARDYMTTFNIKNGGALEYSSKMYKPMEKVETHPLFNQYKS